MAYEYKEEIENHIICAPVHVDDELFDELKEVYAKAKAFNEIVEAYKDSSEQDRLVGIFEGQVTTILDEYTEDK